MPGRGGFAVVETALRSRLGHTDGGLDRVVVTPRLVAVVDGATPKPGDHPAATQIADVVAAGLADLPDRIGAEEAVRRLTDDVAALAVTPSAGSCATFVAYSASNDEIWSVGDGHVLIDGRPVDLPSPADRPMADVRADALHAELASGAGVEQLRRDDPGRRSIAHLLDSLHLYRNASDASLPWRHGAIDGRPVPGDLIHRHVVPAEASELVLATDGYPAIRSSLEETERYLRDVIDADPLLIGRHRATKAVPDRPGASYDDRAYVRVRLDGGGHR